MDRPINANSPTATPSRRRASSAAIHRRPFWAKNETTLQAYRDPRRESAAPFRQSRNQDYGTDNFSYDADHLHHWDLPDDIASHLPGDLLEKTHEWQMAGAAVLTAIDRVREAYRNAMYSAYPDQSSHPLKSTFSAKPSGVDSRRTSAADSVMVGASEYNTPPDSMPETPASPFALNPALWTVLPDNKDALMKCFPQAGMQAPHRVQVLGMESPPFTPSDANASSGYGTPVSVSFSTPHSSGHQPAENVGAGHYMSTARCIPITAGPNIAGNEVVSDIKALHSPSPLSMLSSPVDPLTLSFYPKFSETSWEHYLGRYDELLKDTKECVLRMKGYGRNIQILRTELKAGTTKPEALIALINYGKWWDGMQKKVRDFEVQAESLPHTKLEYVEKEWYSIRASQLGLLFDGALGSEESGEISENGPY